MLPGPWNSRFARRLMKTFTLLVGLPLVVTVASIGKIARDQAIDIGHSTEAINADALTSVSGEFQVLGSKAIARTANRAVAISLNSIHAVSRDVERTQTAALKATARDVGAVTKTNFDDALKHSVETNRAALSAVRDQSAVLIARTARDTQSHVSGQLETTVLNLIRAQMQERADHLATVVDDHVNDHLDFMALSAQMPDIRDANLRGAKPILDAMIRKYPLFLEVALMDLEGRELAISVADRAAASTDLTTHAGEPYVEAATHGDRFAALEATSVPDDPPVLRLAVPVEIYRGKVVGILAARLSLAELWGNLCAARMGENGFVAVSDENGKPVLEPRATAGPVIESSAAAETLHWRVIAALPRSEVLKPIERLKGEIARGANQTIHEMRAHIRTSSRDAARRIYTDTQTRRDHAVHAIGLRRDAVVKRMSATTGAQARANLDHVRAAIARNSRQIQDENNEQMRRATLSSSHSAGTHVRGLIGGVLNGAAGRISLAAALLLILSCVLSLVIALLLARQLVRPITSLAAAAKQVARGDLGHRVPEDAPDEIGDLARTFNEMTAALAESREDLHSAEAQLVQSAKLASLGTLSAGVAHELNQPLAIIRGITQQLQDEHPEPDEIAADLAIIEGQTGRMMKIIKHLRTFARAGMLERADVDANRVINDCFILVGEQLRAHNIRVELDLCDETPLVWADANELEQVFLNLVTNARDALDACASQPDPCLGIRSRCEDGKLMVEIRDNGPGIPPDVASRIFDPFFTTKDPDKGTGLGLSISHSIITKHHGTIEVSSNGGAVFTIRLPLYPQKDEEPDISSGRDAA